jgi:outer membrane protein TolC
MKFIPSKTFDLFKSLGPVKTTSLALSCVFATAIGCSPNKPMYLNDTGDLSFYIDQATAVEYPDADIPSLDEVTGAHVPMTVLDPEFANFEDLTLEDVVSMGLQNTKVIRGYGTPALNATRVLPGQDNLTNGVESAASIYSIAIRESEPGFIAQPGAIARPSAITSNTALDSNQGVEAALADFDAQYTSSFGLSTSDEPRNGFSQFNDLIFVQKQFNWQNEFSKKSANGTQMFFRNINQYTENNNPLTTDIPAGFQVLDSFYRTSLEAEIRQPLLRGRGAFIQRMPIVISRINTDQEIANLEATLQNMVANLEIRYWDLYLAYRSFEAAKTGRDAALETWRIIADQYKEGAEVNIQNVAQAKGQYHFFDVQVIDAYNNLLNAEGQMRFLLGWSSTDGRFIRPIDEPVKAPVEFDWCESLCEALTYRPEVRRRRWEIKKRQLALQYSKNGLLPELNISFIYRWLGLGNRFGTSDNDPPTFPNANSAALNDLYSGNYQELALNGTFAMPIGFRREEANVRNAQLKLAREIARAEDLELDVTKELSETIRALTANQLIMVATFNQWGETDEEVKHFERLEDAGVESLDVALDAQRRRAQAEIAFYTALVEYNKTIALMHHRKGTILPYSGIDFQEGMWPGKAYVDASEHARRRGASRQINYGWTRPQVISRGPNYAGNGNTGYVAPAPSIPVNSFTPINGGQIISDPNGVVPLDAIPLEGSSATQPYYETPSNGVPMLNSPGVIREQNVPTPAVPLSRNYQDEALNADIGAQAVRQVSYDETIDSATAPRAFQPVAVRRSGPILASRPKSVDMASQGMQRIRATVRSANVQLAAPTRKQNTTAATAASNQSNNSNTAARQSGNIDWERLGLTRPRTSSEGTRARIKAN